jgi:hypothetical protein
MNSQIVLCLFLTVFGIVLGTEEGFTVKCVIPEDYPRALSPDKETILCSVNEGTAVDLDESTFNNGAYVMPNNWSGGEPTQNPCLHTSQMQAKFNGGFLAKNKSGDGRTLELSVLPARGWISSTCDDTTSPQCDPASPLTPCPVPDYAVHSNGAVITVKLTTNLGATIDGTYKTLTAVQYEVVQLQNKMGTCDTAGISCLGDGDCPGESESCSGTGNDLTRNATCRDEIPKKACTTDADCDNPEFPGDNCVSKGINIFMSDAVTGWGVYNVVCDLTDNSIWDATDCKTRSGHCTADVNTHCQENDDCLYNTGPGTGTCDRSVYEQCSTKWINNSGTCSTGGGPCTHDGDCPVGETCDNVGAQILLAHRSLTNATHIHRQTFKCNAVSYSSPAIYGDGDEDCTFPAFSQSVTIGYGQWSVLNLEVDCIPDDSAEEQTYSGAGEYFFSALAQNKAGRIGADAEAAAYINTSAVGQFVLSVVPMTASLPIEYDTVGTTDAVAVWLFPGGAKRSNVPLYLSVINMGTIVHWSVPSADFNDFENAQTCWINTKPGGITAQVVPKYRKACIDRSPLDLDFVPCHAAGVPGGCWGDGVNECPGTHFVSMVGEARPTTVNESTGIQNYVGSGIWPHDEEVISNVSCTDVIIVQADAGASRLAAMIVRVDDDTINYVPAESLEVEDGIMDCNLSRFADAPVSFSKTEPQVTATLDTTFLYAPVRNAYNMRGNCAKKSDQVYFKNMDTSEVKCIRVEFHNLAGECLGPSISHNMHEFNNLDGLFQPCIPLTCGTVEISPDFLFDDAGFGGSFRSEPEAPPPPPSDPPSECSCSNYCLQTDPCFNLQLCMGCGIGTGI